MGGNLYMMDADARADRGARRPRREARGALGHRQATTSPSAPRRCVNDAMDIVGGKGICMGPSNFLGAAYMQMPVSITVEGANILTRSLIIFGQGAIRCHPYVLRRSPRRAKDRPRQGLARVRRRARSAIVRFVLRNMARARW